MLLMRFLGLTLIVLIGLLSAPAVNGVAMIEEEQSGEPMDEGKLKITFSPFHISVFSRGQVRGSADIQIVLQLINNSDYEALNSLKPQLRADITAALSTLSRKRWNVNRPIDPDIVSMYLKPFVDHRIGAGRVEVYVLRALINPK